MEVPEAKVGQNYAHQQRWAGSLVAEAPKVGMYAQVRQQRLPEFGVSGPQAHPVQEGAHVCTQGATSSPADKQSPV